MIRILIALVACACAPAAERITVFMYSEYIDPTIPADFTKETGIDVVIDVYEAQEEMLAKLQAGGVGQYDVLVASDVTVKQLVALKLVDPLDRAALPNAKHLWKRFADPAYDRGNAYTLPYLWGTIGLAFRKDALKAEPSWGVLFEPGQRVGAFVLMDESRSMLGSTLVWLGKAANSRDPAELKAAGEALARAKADKRCLGFDNGVAALRRVSAGEAAVAVVYNGDAVRERAENPDLAFAVPKEGGIVAVDNLCVAHQAPNAKAAHAFIDFLWRPEIAARNANTLRYATPNESALPLIDAKLRADPAIYPTDAQMDKLHGLEDLGADTRLYDETWTAVKAR